MEEVKLDRRLQVAATISVEEMNKEKMLSGILQVNGKIFVFMAGWREQAQNGIVWEHVSVSANTMPTWDDMCAVKEIFWRDNEEVHQVHPKKSHYVNMHPNCLHLWRPKNGWREFEDARR